MPLQENPDYAPRPIRPGVNHAVVSASTSLPDLIEIVPWGHPVRAAITVPGSKSITNRALILAALAEGRVQLDGALWSEDTQVMTDALRTLGFQLQVELDPDEYCNRRMTVQGLGGRIPRAGTPQQPLELFVGNAGTAARFLAALVCLGGGVYRLSGVPRMHERPQGALFDALRELGYRVEATNNKLPAVIYGKGGPSEGTSPVTRSCKVSISESSQFASALLLSAERGGWQIEVEGEADEEAPYVAMTQNLTEVFPHTGGRFEIEPDASSGSYFWAAGWISDAFEQRQTEEHKPHRAGSSVQVRSWPESGWQVDADFPNFLPLPVTLSRASQLGDSIMTAIVLAADKDLARAAGRQSGEGVCFTELGRLRVQECERVAALRTELTKCGARIMETGDTLTITPAALHGAEIETYNDHRMAMCLAILGLKVPGIKLKNPACVKKTFPNFFQKLTTPTPRGLGVEIREGRTGRRLEAGELFAD